VSSDERGVRGVLLPSTMIWVAPPPPPPPPPPGVTRGLVKLYSCPGPVGPNDSERCARRPAAVAKVSPSTGAGASWPPSPCASPLSQLSPPRPSASAAACPLSIACSAPSIDSVTEVPAPDHHPAGRLLSKTYR
jgi:hypothetical protein